ncbi:MAG: hypothetical protein M9884_11245 [Rhodocyclaceae bacterium]|nr:hypothetical protein [Rhodocyclaceae bacterium]
MSGGQRGFSIVTAIFLIVILAALGAFAVSMFRVQQTTAAYDELGARGYQAAQAGIEWGAWQALRTGRLRGCNDQPGSARLALAFYRDGRLRLDRAYGGRRSCYDLSIDGHRLQPAGGRGLPESRAGAGLRRAAGAGGGGAMSAGKIMCQGLDDRTGCDCRPAGTDFRG